MKIVKETAYPVKTSLLGKLFFPKKKEQRQKKNK